MIFHRLPMTDALTGPMKCDNFREIQGVAKIGNQVAAEVTLQLMRAEPSVKKQKSQGCGLSGMNRSTGCAACAKPNRAKTQSQRMKST